MRGGDDEIRARAWQTLNPLLGATRQVLVCKDNT